MLASGMPWSHAVVSVVTTQQPARNNVAVAMHANLPCCTLFYKHAAAAVSVCCTLSPQ
jgi:hypothetical protein